MHKKRYKFYLQDFYAQKSLESFFYEEIQRVKRNKVISTNHRHLCQYDQILSKIENQGLSIDGIMDDLQMTLEMDFDNIQIL